MIFSSTFGEPVPDGAQALYGLPGLSVCTHTGADPLPPHATIALD
jgi:hypothetical protein